jgi:hypothetical protein
MRIEEAACRYVREQAPTPPRAVLECVARIVLQATAPTGFVVVPDRTIDKGSSRLEVA